MLIDKTAFTPETFLTISDNLEFFVRIIVAGILGGIIGLERTKRQKDAGIRTHCIIAVASAVFMILSKYAFLDMAAVSSVVGSKGVDPSRIASQVVTGISFLGAGVIFKNEKLSVKGLTTAAGVWGTAAIGMAVGSGLYWVGVLTTIAFALIQWFFHRFPIGNDFYVDQKLFIKMEEDSSLINEIENMISSNDGEVICSATTRQDGYVMLDLTIRIEQRISFDQSIAFMQSHEKVKQFSV